MQEFGSLSPESAEKNSVGAIFPWESVQKNRKNGSLFRRVNSWRMICPMFLPGDKNRPYLFEVKDNFLKFEAVKRNFPESRNNESK
ncbi:hypothetical protein B5F83_04235 [Muribaculum sp. An289]|nr:hypothetical protein B5F83_04235 [Muribaculum sp. An289]OUO43361.1 hypothetical protein B5F81_03795 [Muribaculum sp. An287]